MEKKNVTRETRKRRERNTGKRASERVSERS